MGTGRRDGWDPGSLTTVSTGRLCVAVGSQGDGRRMGVGRGSV